MIGETYPKLKNLTNHTVLSKADKSLIKTNDVKDIYDFDTFHHIKTFNQALSISIFDILFSFMQV